MIKLIVKNSRAGRMVGGKFVTGAAKRKPAKRKRTRTVKRSNTKTRALRTYDVDRSLGKGDWKGMFSVQAQTPKEARTLAKRRIASGSYGRGRIRVVARRNSGKRRKR